MAISIIKHNYPLRYVEHEGYRDLHNFLHSDAKPISRNTAKVDVLKIYSKEKEKLKHALESIPSRICLTSDLWSSLTTDGYMTLTAHYVDGSWDLQKRILNFRHTPSPHNGSILAEKVTSLLKERVFEKKIFTITLDNASYNDGLVGVVKDHLSLADSLLCDGEFFHVHCGAHILNLIIQEGLKVIDEAVKNVRESVKYVRGTQGRKKKFAKCIAQLSLKSDDVARVRNKLKLLFEEYVCLSPMVSTTGSSCGVGACDADIGDIPESQGFDIFESQHYGEGTKKSQLDIYLEETSLSRVKHPNLDVLHFWKENLVCYR
ncbi:hypothetical protein L1049_012904 [Liquidambar formosana]|uniref:Uncharacterized protein n=1 Tax=Liquidambar formosana TaxID=63359 RepID=A0AAP0RNF3_LIQFO